MKNKSIRGWRTYCAVPFVLCNLFGTLANAADGAELLIDRASKTLVVKDGDKQLSRCWIGIGKGGIGVKKSMSDLITPAGEFVVDLILYKKDSAYDDIAPALLQRYKHDPRLSLLQNKQGLSKLFENMNSIDFNLDGKADTAYGTAYLGLDGVDESLNKSANGDRQKPVTGSKLSMYGRTAYWFSIALHGTPDEAANIGRTNSGGCVHVPADELQKLIENKTVRVGTHVFIR